MSDMKWAEVFARDLRMVWENDYITQATLVELANNSADKYEFGRRCHDLYNVYIDLIDRALEADKFLPDGARGIVMEALYNPGVSPFDLLADEMYEYLRTC